MFDETNKNCFQNNHSHLGYCGIAADYGCCTAAHASHIHAGSFPNSAEEKKPTEYTTFRR